eukprot:CAMPEP_0183291794 /NCGR_PEP_ID=MMETSP0160_2-20130417/1085_1 /TAXON_ID=2839 ORGANISM="Odontella Sinensis, Strain Grunow 1884" /NCGR_SAMPLE_ID=MMETSP0160_2 /ASSEMBLY_ACC=CAM_ASM_000250 /LENGTH=108 /DNA_ID=CAMNT_0025452643 /DNA_START=75 /DNA_END=399 /DNA_ORIENTATION=+
MTVVRTALRGIDNLVSQINCGKHLLKVKGEEEDADFGGNDDCVRRIERRTAATATATATAEVPPEEDDDDATEATGEERSRSRTGRAETSTAAFRRVTTAKPVIAEEE